MMNSPTPPPLLDQHICDVKEQCKASIKPTRKWIRPKEFSIADDETLKKILAPLKLPEPEFKGEDYIHGNITENKQVFKCDEPNCKAAFASETSLKSHFHKHKTRTLKCSFCGIIFKANEDLVAHKDEFHPCLNLLPNANPLQCKKCKKITRDKKALWRHVRESHRNITYPCHICLFPFTRPENLKDHLKCKHPSNGEEVPKYTCKLCKKDFAHINSWRTHIRGSHRGISKVFQCVLCNTVYFCKQTYRNHMKHHVNPKFFPCKICRHTFRSRNHLNRHKNSFRHKCEVKKNMKSKEKNAIEKTTNTSDYTAEPKDVFLLQKQLSTQELLQLCSQRTLKIILHPVDSTIISKSPATLDKRKFKLFTPLLTKKVSGNNSQLYYLNCLYCDKNFPNLQAIKSHEEQCFMEYRNPKVNICPQCDKEFDKPFKLVNHLRVHSDAREFKCLHCDKFFKSNRTRVQHEKSLHFGIRYQPAIHRVFRCNFEGCSKQYRTDKSLKKHLESVHLGIRYPCGKCGRIYRRRDQLRNHLKVDHAEYPMRLQCKPCNRTYKNRTNFLFHMKRKRHHRKTLEFENRTGQKIQIEI